MAEDNKKEQLIDQYLRGELEGEALDRFNARIEADEAFRSEVAFQSRLRKSVRQAKVAQWKKGWEEDEGKQRTGWWPWLLGLVMIAIIVIAFWPGRGSETDGSTGSSNSTTTESSTNTTQESGNTTEEESNGSNEGEIEETEEEQPEETNKKQDPLPMASLDLKPYWNADDFPVQRINKSSGPPEQFQWKISESDALEIGFSGLQKDLENHIDTLQNTNEALRLQLLNGFLLLRSGQYAEAESRIREVLDSQDAYELQDVARWYLGLTLIKQNKRQAARATLEDIANYEGGGHFKQREAQRLLDALKAYN